MYTKQAKITRRKTKTPKRRKEETNEKYIALTEEGYKEGNYKRTKP